MAVIGASNAVIFILSMGLLSSFGSNRDSTASTLSDSLGGPIGDVLLILAGLSMFVICLSLAIWMRVDKQERSERGRT